MKNFINEIATIPINITNEDKTQKLKPLAMWVWGKILREVILL